MLHLTPGGEPVRYGNLTVTSNTPPLKLTSFQSTSLYLSNAIARARIETAAAANEHYTRMKHFQWAVAIVGAVTTILISIKSMSNQNTTLYVIIGILAIFLSSVGTATSSLNSFYSPREAHIRNQRALSSLKQLHVEVAAEMNIETDADKCQAMRENDNSKKVKNWSQRLAGIVNGSETAAQVDGKLTQPTPPASGPTPASTEAVVDVSPAQ
jgi:hypothetical protein